MKCSNKPFLQISGILNKLPIIFLSKSIKEAQVYRMEKSVFPSILFFSTLLISRNGHLLSKVWEGYFQSYCTIGVELSKYRCNFAP
tara:strand:- start:1013 stop:1270 length:258 start_codon:yes stop_codon:yes gene_type:complete